MKLVFRFVSLVFVGLALVSLTLPSCGNGGVGGGGVGISGPCGDVGDTGDDDGDGVDNQTDLCCESPAGLPVDADGCPVDPCPQGDDDEDGVCNDADLCPQTPSRHLEPVDETGCNIFDECCPCDTPWVSKADYLSCIAYIGDAVVCQEKDVCRLPVEDFDERCKETERRRLGRILRFAAETTCAA